MLTRVEATERILVAKKAKGVTFEAIAKAVGRHKVWVTAALMGQATMSAEEANAVAQLLPPLQAGFGEHRNAIGIGYIAPRRRRPQHCLMVAAGGPIV